MSYGLRVRDSRGAVTLDVSDRVSRLIWMSSITNSNGNQVLSELAGLKSTQFAIATNPSITNTMPSISRSGNTISWTFWSDGYGFFSNGNCIIYVYAYT